MRIVIDTAVISRKAYTAIERVQAVKPVAVVSNAVRNNADVVMAAMAGCAAWEACELLLNTVGGSLLQSSAFTPLTGLPLFWYVICAFILSVSAAYVITTVLDKVTQKNVVDIYA